MSAITPQTELRLIKCPLESDNRHQLTFSNETSQYNYFNSLPYIDVDNFTYQRKDGIIRYPGCIDDIETYNYVMYQNEAFTNKWFYAYITNMNFVSANMTEITIKTDVFQTWQFSLDYKKSYIERKHVTDDSIGANLVDEGIETGDYICNLSNDITIGTGDLIVCYCSDFPILLQQYFKKSVYNNIYSGAKGIVFASVQDASYFVTYMETQAKGDAIVSMFILPNSIFDGDLTFITKTLDLDPTLFGVDHVDLHFAPIDESYTETFMGTTTITLNNTLNGYTPKNNKLLTGKYNYFYITNNIGNDVEYHYEDFVNNSPSFELIGAVCPGGSMQLIPLNYNKISDSGNSRKSYNYGITGPKFPICSWNSDSYTMWLSENSLNMNIDKTKSISSIIAGITAMAISPVTGGSSLLIGAGLTVSGVSGIAETMKSNYLHSRVPDQSKGNINNGDVQYASGKCCYSILKMSIRYEYAKRIDDYLSAYGYKVNSFEVPSIHTRSKWNFIKTIGVNIEGDIPEKDLDEIKNIFNKGITFWHDPLYFLDYSQNNTIL